MKRKAIDHVRDKIKTGLAQLNRREGIPGDKVYAQLKRKSERFRKNRP